MTPDRQELHGGDPGEEGARPSGPQGEQPDDSSQRIADLLWKVKLPRYADFAQLHEEQGEYTQAEYYYWMLAEGQRRVLGEDHPDLARTFYNLARLYHHHEFEHVPDMAIMIQSLGTRGCAVLLYKPALTIRRQALGDRHPDVAQSLAGLASLYQDGGQYAEALPLYEEALAIQRQEAGNERSEIARTLNRIAELYQALGNPSAALPLLKEALAIQRHS